MCLSLSVQIFGTARRLAIHIFGIVRYFPYLWDTYFAKSPMWLGGVFYTLPFVFLTKPSARYREFPKLPNIFVRNFLQKVN